MISQDDLEMFTRMNKIMSQTDSDDEDAAVWVDFSRGRESEDRRDAEVAVAGSTSEMVFRNMWKAWLDHMVVDRAPIPFDRAATTRFGETPP